MKKLLLASLITLLAFGTACGQAAEPEPVADDGIQVHGHWTVTVTNPDGSVDAVHEFDNALTDYGKLFLAMVFMGERKLDDDPPNHFILISGNNLSQSVTCEGDKSPIYEGFQSISLTPTVVLESQNNVFEIDLTASCLVTEVEEGFIPEIQSVGVGLEADQPIFFGSNVFLFTNHILNPKATFEVNQTLAFNVTISFN